MGVVSWEHAGKGWKQEDLAMSVGLGRDAVVTEGEEQPLKWKEGNIAVKGGEWRTGYSSDGL